MPVEPPVSTCASAWRTPSSAGTAARRPPTPRRWPRRWRAEAEPPSPGVTGEATPRAGAVSYVMLRHMGRDEGLLLGEAARAIGVSQDTLRRWDRTGKLRTVRDSANRRRVPRREVERLMGHPDRHRVGDGLSARNRFPGIVRSVEVDGVMALVEIEAGPFLVTAAVTRDAVEELGLACGVAATAAVKATSVMVERGVS